MSRNPLIRILIRLFLESQYPCIGKPIMKNLPLLVMSLAAFLQLSPCVLAAEGYTVPRTEWGQPDLQGVWNFSSEVPMERPEHYGDRQFLREEEIAATKAQPLRIGRSDNVRQTASGIEAFYNDTIWMENIAREGDIRTSHIVYPLNGQIPPLAEGIEHQPGGVGRIDGQRPVRFSVGGNWARWTRRPGIVRAMSGGIQCRVPS